MTAHRGVLVEPDGTVTVKSFDTVDLEALTSTVGARYVDLVRVAPVADADHLSLDAWVDDEGVFNAEHNPVATHMVATLAGRPCQRFHGNMLFVAGDINTGDSVGLPSDSEKELLEMGKHLALVL